MTTVQKVIGYVLVSAVGIGFIYGMGKAGWQFNLGVLCGVAIIQCAHRSVYGRWIDF